MHDTELTHESLEHALQCFQNLAGGHVPADEQTKTLALGLADLTDAVMKINRQIHDIEDLVESSK